MALISFSHQQHIDSAVKDRRKLYFLLEEYRAGLRGLRDTQFAAITNQQVAQARELAAEHLFNELEPEVARILGAIRTQKKGKKGTLP